MNDTRDLIGLTNELRKNLCEFPAHFAKAIVIGTREEFHTATATLVDLGQGPMAVTCAHVLNPFMKQWIDGHALIRIGNVRIAPSQVCAISAGVDLATIRLSGEQVAELVSEDGIEVQFYEPTRWPLEPAKAGETVAIGGFPAPWREKRRDTREIICRYYGIGATQVSSASERRFCCNFEREHWIWVFHPGKLPELRMLGGLSGGPVFAERHLRRELVGIVSEFNENWDIMLMNHTHWIRPDGSIDGR